MKRKLLVVVFVFLVSFSIVFGENEVGVEVLNTHSEAEAGGEAVYQVKVTNHQGDRDIIRVNYDEFGIYPFSETTQNILFNPSQLKLDPLESGIFNITINILDTAKSDISFETEFEVYSLTKPEVKEKINLVTYVVPPKELIKITPSIPDEIFPGEEYNIKIKFMNRVNNELKNIEIVVHSDLPQLQKGMVYDFMPKEKITETMKLKTNLDVKPGDYVVNIKAYYKESNVVGSYSSAFIVSENKDIEEIIDKKIGFLSKTTTVTKKNKGNTVSDQKIEVKLNFLKKLFTSTDPDPEVEKGVYVWESKVEPNEEFSVRFTSNYRPILYGIIIIIIATIVMNILIQKTVIIKKRIIRIKKTKEGFNEMKVLVYVKNGKSKSMSNVKIMDVAPLVIKPTGEYGTLHPTKVQQGTKGERLVWDIGRLDAGEERILSYKVVVKKELGQLRLPPALLQFVNYKGKTVMLRSAAILIEHQR